MILKKNKFKKKVFIIAEVGNNHEGNFNVAKKLIHLAAKAGADAIKFQTFKTENFINKKNKKRFNQLKKFELKYNQFEKLKKIAHKKKLFFISTPLDIASAVFLNKTADIIKIASSDNNFFPLLDVVTKSKKPLIISTGMTSFSQIKHLISYFNKKVGKKVTEKNISLLQCVTSYPVEDKYANLNSIPFLIKNTKLRIGYSDHTIGYEACLGAVALGAKIIEKHFTLSKNYSKFRDHAISSDFAELKKIVDGIRKLEKQMGFFDKKILKPEKKIIKLVRRNVHATQNIQVGSKINLGNVKFLRKTSTDDYLHLKDIIGKTTKKKIFRNQRIDLKKLI